MRILIILASLLLALPAVVCLQAGGAISLLGGAACLVWLGLFFLALAGYRKQGQEEDNP